MIDTKVIRARADVANPGEWHKRSASTPHGFTHTVCLDTTKDGIDERHVRDVARNVCIDLTGNDATFIAHARTDIPALCDEVDELRAQLSDRTSSVIIEGGRALACSEVVAEAFAELRATLDNERGKGGGEGWVYYPGGPAWSHAESMTWARRGEHGWNWYRYAANESDIEARGDEPTARAAMKAANLARVQK